MGLPDADARGYAHFGCNWPTTGDNGCWMCNTPKSVHLCPDLPKEEKELFKLLFMRNRDGKQKPDNNNERKIW